MATVGRILWVLVVTAVLFLILAVAVFPTRTLIDQRSIRSETRLELDQLETEVEDLTERVDALNTPDEIERLAREQYFMVRPGEEPYVIRQLDESTIPVPDGWPFHRLDPATP